jgi:hypothetical protein
LSLDKIKTILQQFVCSLNYGKVTRKPELAAQTTALLAEVEPSIVSTAPQPNRELFPTLRLSDEPIAIHAVDIAPLHEAERAFYLASTKYKQVKIV